MAKNMKILHDLNAISDDKIQRAIEKKGLAVYGFYWCVLEYMGKNNGYVTVDDIGILARLCWIRNDYAKRLFYVLVSNGLFVELTDEEARKTFSENSPNSCLAGASEVSSECLAGASEVSSLAVKSAKKFYSVRLLKDIAKVEQKREKYRNNINQRWKRNYSNSNNEERAVENDKEENTTEIQSNNDGNTMVASCSYSCSCSNNKKKEPTNVVSKKSKETKPDFNAFLEAQEPELRDDWKAFADMRKSIKKPVTEYGLQLLSGKLHKMATDIPGMKAIIEQSITNCYQGLFEVNNGNGNKNASKNLNYGRVTTSNADWIGQKGGRIELD